MKWYVIVDKYIDGRECVGINDESYFGDGEIISTHATDDEADSAAREYAQASGLPLLADIEQEGDHMEKKMNWNENFDLNVHGDFFAVEVECEEGSQYVYYRGTYRNGEGREFPDATLEVFLCDPVYLDVDGNIVIPAAWENFWILGHELP